jgi:hypothetical protein
MDEKVKALCRAIGYFGEVKDRLGVVHKSPWPTQIEGHESRSRFKALFAGARYGKSKWGAYDVLPDVCEAGTRGWIVGPSYEQPSKEFRYIYEALVQKLGYKVKGQNLMYSSPGGQFLRTPWGSEVFTKSEENPDSLLSEELDWILLSEGSRLKEKTFDEFLRPRLGTRNGRVVVPTTPHGYNWIYKRFYIPAVEGGDKEYWSKIVKVIENPLFSREEYERMKKELPEDIFR